MDNTLVIRGGFVVSPSLAFTGLTTYLTVDARSISMEDRVKFVPVSESCAAEATEYAYMEGRVYTVEVTFTEAAEYKMCYKYADEATYLEVPEYVMHVHSTEEAVVLPVHADVTEGVTISLLGEQRSPEQEQYLAPEKMSVVRELSTAAVYGDVSSIADEKDFTYARFLGAANVAVVYKLQSPVVLSSVVLKSASGARSVMKATVYISVHSASGPWEKWMTIEETEAPTEAKKYLGSYEVAEYVKVVVNANFGASSTEIADLKLYYVESESDVLVRFVAPSTVSSMQCESAETPAVKYYAYANEVVLNTHGLNDYVMCAKMDGNWILFPSVKLQVHAVADFSPKTFIAGSEYAVTFTGAAIAEEDAIFFTAKDCEATSVLPTTTETATVRRVTFGAQQSALHACYGVKSVMMLAPEVSVVETVVRVASSLEVFPVSKVVFEGPALSVSDVVKVVAKDAACGAEAVAQYAVRKDAAFFITLALPQVKAQYTLCYLFNGDILSQDRFALSVSTMTVTPARVFTGVEATLAVTSDLELSGCALQLCDGEQHCATVAIEEGKAVFTPAANMASPLAVALVKDGAVMETGVSLEVVAPVVESMLPREAFLGMDSVFTFEGAALEATSGAVRVRFTKTTCEESVATATLVEKTATVRFESAEEELRVCVAYGEGAFALVEPTVKVYGVSAVTPAQVTVGKTTELRLSGVGIAEGDEVRVVSAGSACDSTPMGVGFVTDGAVALYVMSGAADVVDVCYSFNQFDLGMTKQPVTLAVVESAEPEVVEMEGARLVSFVGVEKKLRFAELEIDDKVSWTDAADCSEMVMEPVRVNENKEVTVEFSAGADELLLCVCTNGVDFVLQSNVTMAVVSVSGIDVADMVLGLEESVAVNGTGLAYAVDMYFVRGGVQQRGARVDDRERGGRQGSGEDDGAGGPGAAVRVVRGLHGERLRRGGDDGVHGRDGAGGDAAGRREGGGAAAAQRGGALHGLPAERGGGGAQRGGAGVVGAHGGRAERRVHDGQHEPDDVRRGEEQDVADGDAAGSVRGAARGGGGSHEPHVAA